MMSRVEIGVIRVITTDDWDFLETHGKMISAYIGDQNLDVITDRIEGFPEGIPNEKEEERAVPFVIDTAERMLEANDLDAIFVSCAADPGVSELQYRLEIPIVGAGATSAYVAKSFGHRIGVLGIDEEAPRVIFDVLGESLVRYHRPDAVTTTLDIADSVDDYVSLARTLVDEDEAGVILLACTGLSTAGMAPKIRNTALIPVIDPVISSGLIAYYAARGNLIERGD
ncbi:MAG: aspartate/glutamate racemase family protein [Promethearchaeia archaeon]